MMWKLGELARDSFRSLAIPHVLILIALTAALAWSSWQSASAADRAITQEAHVRGAGADIWIAQAGSHGPLPATPCINLAYGEGVVSAGGVYTGQIDTLTAFLGGAPLPVNKVTPGWAAVYVPGIAPGATVGQTLVDEHRFEPGGTLFDTAGWPVTTITVVARRNAPTQLLSAGISIPATQPVGLAECAIRMAAGSNEYGRSLLRTAFGPETTVTAFNPQDNTLDSPWQQWISVTSPPVGLAVGIVMALIVFLMQWFRRRDIAIYRAFGATKTTVTAGALIEAALVTLPSTALGIVITVPVAFGRLSRDVHLLEAAGINMLIVIAAFITAYAAATALVATRNPARTLADQ